MGEVLFHLRDLSNRRAARRWWLALTLAALALCALPLLASPGYELSLALTLLLGTVGTAAATHLSFALPFRPAAALAVAAGLLSSTVPAVLLAALRAPPCDPWFNAEFLPVLTLPGALLSAALGQAIARVTRRGWTAGLLLLAALLLSVAHTAWPILFGPQVFAFNHLGGYVPGPLYDEELVVTPALLWFRAGTLALALALAGRWKVLWLGLFLFIEARGVAFGFRMTDEALAETLGGKVETPGFVLFHSRSFSRDELRLMVADVDFRLRQNREFFGGEPEQVRVWWYANAKEKHRLVGAAHTQFAKPWRREIHVNGGYGFPHPVIKHELVHALAASWGRAPFGVAAGWLGLAPRVAVIEGLAVAADNPRDELTLHEWAAAMKTLELLPEVSQLMTPGGFYLAPPSRAYATAGSFLRFLEETRGKEKLRALAYDGDFERAYEVPLDTLAEEYLNFLDTVPLDERARGQAQARFRRGSLFDRPCAREVNALAAQAKYAPPAQALSLLSRCRALQPEEPSHALSYAYALRQACTESESGTCARDAAEVLDSELDRLAPHSAAWAEAALARADLALELGEQELAQSLWQRVIAAPVSPALERTARVRLDGAGSAAVNRFFTAESDAKKLAALYAGGDSLPVRYLLGRRLVQLGDYAAALPHLDAVLTFEPPEALLHETQRLKLEALYATGACSQLVELAAQSPRFAEWAERCRASAQQVQ